MVNHIAIESLAKQIQLASPFPANALFVFEGCEKRFQLNPVTTSQQTKPLYPPPPLSCSCLNSDSTHKWKKTWLGCLKANKRCVCKYEQSFLASFSLTWQPKLEFRSLRWLPKLQRETHQTEENQRVSRADKIKLYFIFSRKYSFTIPNNQKWGIVGKPFCMSCVVWPAGHLLGNKCFAIITLGCWVKFRPPKVISESECL